MKTIDLRDLAILEDRLLTALLTNDLINFTYLQNKFENTVNEYCHSL
jgi:hypothetical protein